MFELGKSQQRKTYLLMPPPEDREPSQLANSDGAWGGQNNANEGVEKDWISYRLVHNTVPVE